MDKQQMFVSKFASTTKIALNLLKRKHNLGCGLISHQNLKKKKKSDVGYDTYIAAA